MFGSFLVVVLMTVCILQFSGQSRRVIAASENIAVSHSEDGQGIIVESYFLHRHF